MLGTYLQNWKYSQARDNIFTCRGDMERRAGLPRFSNLSVNYSYACITKIFRKKHFEIDFLMSESHQLMNMIFFCDSAMLFHIGRHIVCIKGVTRNSASNALPIWQSLNIPMTHFNALYTLISFKYFFHLTIFCFCLAINWTFLPNLASLLNCYNLLKYL